MKHPDRSRIQGVRSSFDILDFGLKPYREVWDEQRRQHERVVAGGKPVLMMGEHPPVLTLGRKAREGQNIVVTRDYLMSQNIEVHEIERGGDVTYHGPGQLVAYAIFPVGRKIVDFLRLLETATIQTLQHVGLEDARPNPGYAGVYVSPREVGGLSYDQKIASFGVAVKRHVALHGVGLNVTTHLPHFDLIVPCGLQQTHMTSIENEFYLRKKQVPSAVPSVNEVKQIFAQSMKDVFHDYDWSLPSFQ